MADLIDLTTKHDERTIAEVLDRARAGEPIPDTLAERFDAAATRLLAKSPTERVFVRDAAGRVEILRPPEPTPWHATLDGRFRTAVLVGMTGCTLAMLFLR